MIQSYHKILYGHARNNKTRLVVPIEAKRVKIFKSQKNEPHLDGFEEDENKGEQESEAQDNKGDNRDGNGSEEDEV